MVKTNKEVAHLQESTAVQFSLSFLIQIIGTVVLAVWGYSQLDARISNVHNLITTHTEKIRTIEVEMKESQDKPIPSDHVQNTKLYAHERELQELRSRLNVLEARQYDNRRRGFD